MSEQFLTYMHLLTPLHTGGSADEGNLMGIAREVHTEFPYLPASSIRGRIRAAIEKQDELKEEAGRLFGQKIEGGNQPTEGEVWFGDATLLFFPVASLNYHIVWITCPLWLGRLSRWLDDNALQKTLELCDQLLSDSQGAMAIVSLANCDSLYLQTALLGQNDMHSLGDEAKNELNSQLVRIVEQPCLGKLIDKLVILNNEDCLSLLEIGLQREVRVALEENSKTVKGGSFRSEEAIPPETILFFPWGLKSESSNGSTQKARQKLPQVGCDKRLQFGGLEGLGRGWITLMTFENRSN
jgi:CRISPR-associated protein Cmr4